MSGQYPFLFLFPFLLPAAAVGATQANAQSSDWTPTLISPSELARRVDSRLHSLKDTSMIYNFTFKTPPGGKGFFRGTCVVRSQTKYRLEYPLLGKTDEVGLGRRTVIRDGNKTTIITSYSAKGNKKSVVIHGAVPYPRHGVFVDEWFMRSVELVLGAIGTSVNPMSSFVKSAISSHEYKVEAETRVVIFRQKPLRSYRITVVRNPSFAKKKGPFFAEVLIGDVYYLPLALSCETSSGKKGYSTVMSGTRWNRNPHQRFRADDFNTKVPHVVVDTSK